MSIEVHSYELDIILIPAFAQTLENLIYVDG